VLLVASDRREDRTHSLSNQDVEYMTPPKCPFQPEDLDSHLIENEIVPKIIINDTVNLFFLNAISILVISNHNSFRVLCDKTASVYFI